MNSNTFCLSNHQRGWLQNIIDNERLTLKWLTRLELKMVIGVLKNGYYNKQQKKEFKVITEYYIEKTKSLIDDSKFLITPSK